MGRALTHADPRFAVGDSTLGALLVAATPRGLCAVALGDAPEPLVDALRAGTPGAVRDDAGLAPVLAAVAAVVADPRRPADLPLDPAGTDFQRRVWAALRAIPAGQVRTYTELAAGLGGASANRAVAGACAANPLAVLVPCHRVVRADGGLGGYRWGIERKRALLRQEGALTLFGR